jgi:hypothetical protein
MCNKRFPKQDRMLIAFKISFFLVLLPLLGLSQSSIESHIYTLDWKDQTSLRLMQSKVQNPSVSSADLFYHARPTYSYTVSEVVLKPIKTVIIDNILDLQILSDFKVEANITKSRNESQLYTVITPYRLTGDGKIERLEEVEVTYTYGLKNATQQRGPLNENSVLASGDLYKLAIAQTGIHKIDFATLESGLGIDVSKINPKKIKIYTNRGGRVPESNATSRVDDLVEIPLLVNGESDNVFNKEDFALFYVEGPDRIEKVGTSYTYDKNIYDFNNYIFLRTDGQDGIRIQTEITNPSNITNITSYTAVERWENDLTNLLGSFPGAEGTGKEWYGEYFRTERELDLTSKFKINEVVLNTIVDVNMIFAGRSAVSSQMSLGIGTKKFSRTIGESRVLDSEAIYARKAVVNEAFTITDLNPKVIISYPKVNVESEGWLDYLQLTYNKKLTFSEDQFTLRLQNPSPTTGSIDLSSNSGYTFWNITDPLSPILLPINDNKAWINLSNTQTILAALKSQATALKPKALGKIPNQNLHAINNVDAIIVYHPNFKSDAERLAQHRRAHSGMEVALADVTQVYNEYASGRTDPGAIRDFVRQKYVLNNRLKYLVLFGDGSYDYKGLVKDINQENFIPVYETDESLDPIDGFPSDDFYGLLDDNEGVNLKGGLDIYLGRLPAKSMDEAKTLVDKIIHYETSPETLGDWRMRLTYTADDEDNNTHIGDMDGIARLDETRHPNYNQQKVYFDAYNQISTSGENRFPDATTALNNSMTKGQLSLTYLGHGGPLGWAQERVLTIPDIVSWNNYNAMTILVTATCSFAAYDDPSILTPAENAILNPKGGAIALFSTTRAVYTSSNRELTNAVNEVMYKKINGKAPTLGYTLATGKNKFGNDSFFRINSRKFSLLGDPTMQVAMPHYIVNTTEVNQLPSNQADTLNALEKVTIKGNILDDNGQIVTGFNGTIFPTVYDKKSKVQTLGNDNSSPKFDFTAYRNVLFSGSATVKNGTWEFTFWVPKNINYAYGNGRISYYAKDDKNTDAAGYFTNFIIGGTNKNLVADDNGPELEIFVNSESFNFGDPTGSDITLLLDIEDDLGINVTGSSIGQDITGVLDGNQQNVYILNDFYKAEKDNFKRGKVAFPIKNLELGRHEITAKVWDIAGNSTEKRTEFVVVDDLKEAIKNLYNFPNPFTTQTNFSFELPQSNTNLEIIVYIYSISGRLVKTITHTGFYSGNRVTDIFWNARDDYDSNIARGLYLYKVVVQSPDKRINLESNIQKLIKL